MNYKYAFDTSVGMKRSQNQDNGAPVSELNLYMVADGMGGHRGGETASAIAVEMVKKTVAEGETQKNWEASTLIRDAILSANNEIYKQSSENPKLQGMGTTTTALLFQNQTLNIGQVGDSRCYYLRPGSIWQLTRDHSLVQEKLRAGIITRAELETDKMKNVITRSVGFEPHVSVETFKKEVQAGDLFLVCSDGLSGMINDETIREIVDKFAFEQNDLDRAVQELIDAANKNGGDDNITVLLVQAVS